MMDTPLPRFDDTIAAIVVLSLPLYIGLSILGVALGFSALGAHWFSLYSFIVVMSATKLYGKGVYNAVKEQVNFTK